MEIQRGNPTREREAKAMSLFSLTVRFPKKRNIKTCKRVNSAYWEMFTVVWSNSKLTND